MEMFQLRVRIGSWLSYGLGLSKRKGRTIGDFVVRRPFCYPWSTEMSVGYVSVCAVFANGSPLGQITGTCGASKIRFSENHITFRNRSGPPELLRGI